MIEEITEKKYTVAIKIIICVNLLILSYFCLRFLQSCTDFLCTDSYKDAVVDSEILAPSIVFFLLFFTIVQIWYLSFDRVAFLKVIKGKELETLSDVKSKIEYFLNFGVLSIIFILIACSVIAPFIDILALLLIPVAMFTVPIFALIGFVQAACYFLKICSSKKVFFIVSLLLVVQITGLCILHLTTVMEEIKANEIKSKNYRNAAVLSFEEKIASLRQSGSVIADLDKILEEYQNSNIGYLKTELTLEIVNNELEKLVKDLIFKFAYVSKNNKGELVFKETVDVDNLNIDKPETNYPVKRARFLFNLKRSLEVVEKDCNKKIHSYEIIIYRDTTNSTIQFIALNNDLMYKGFSYKNFVEVSEFPYMYSEIYYQTNEDYVSNIFKVAQDDKNIIVCSHAEKSADLEPLLYVYDQSKESNKTDSKKTEATLFMLRPIDFTGGYEAPVSATSTLNDWHMYMTQEFQKTFPFH